MNDTIMIVPSDPSLTGCFELRLHRTVWAGLARERLIGTADGGLDADALEAWADGAPNPSGQKAEIARVLAHLGRFGAQVVDVDGARLPVTFWDVVGS